MSYGQSKTMQDVVMRLREGSAEALLELLELHVAVGELVLSFQVLSAVATELARESSELCDAPDLATSERIRTLADAAAKMNHVIDGQSRALSEIQRGLDAWNLVQPGLRLV